MTELRIFDSLFHQEKNYPLEASISQILGGEINSLSTAELINKVNDFSAGLLKLGFKCGDKFSIAAFNSIYWVIVDLAAAQIGMIHVPLYPNASAEDYSFIMNQAEVKLAFAGNLEIYEKFKAADVKHNLEIYSLFTSKEAKNWESIYKKASTEDLKEIEAYKAKIKTKDLATIIYTSGTTGEPKGVMLSHKNIMTNAYDVADAIQIVGKKYRALSFLPLCHIFERTALYTYLYTGISIYYPENLDNLGEDMKLVKPHFFTTVPRVLEKIYEKIQAKAATLSPLKQKLFNWAMCLAKASNPSEKPTGLQKVRGIIADKLIFSKWRDAVGNNIQFIISGAAALQPELVTIFTFAGIPIQEAYGLTEASPGISGTRKENIKPGSVGPAFSSVEIKINPDGEVLAKGPNIMMGYYQRPEATAEVLKDGWLYTGDLGKIDEEGNLHITGRKKELFKTSGGKYIAPQKIENLLKSSSLVDQVIVVGEDQKFPAALIVPAFDFLKLQVDLSKNGKNLNYRDEIKTLYQEMIDKVNGHLGKYEQIKNFYILDEAWTIESGELTPTLKVKRKVIQSKYSSEITSLY